MESEEEKQAESDLRELENNPTWKPQSKMSQVLSKIRPLRRNDYERIAND